MDDGCFLTRGIGGRCHVASFKIIHYVCLSNSKHRFVKTSAQRQHVFHYRHPNDPQIFSFVLDLRFFQSFSCVPSRPLALFRLTFFFHIKNKRLVFDSGRLYQLKPPIDLLSSLLSSQNSKNEKMNSLRLLAERKVLNYR